IERGEIAIVEVVENVGDLLILLVPAHAADESSVELGQCAFDVGGGDRWIERESANGIVAGHAAAGELNQVIAVRSAESGAEARRAEVEVLEQKAAGVAARSAFEGKGDRFLQAHVARLAIGVEHGGGRLVAAD